MAPLRHFQFLVLGGGSGGIAAARRAAEFLPGAGNVALVEKARFGGTCVNVGCVPKKLMFHAAQHAEEVGDMRDYGLDVSVGKAFDWAGMKKKRDDYIKRLNGIYARNLENSKVEVIEGEAKFLGTEYLMCTRSPSTY